jgi:hypothetical protein
MILGRRPDELHAFARTRESFGAQTLIPSGHSQPAGYHQTLLPFLIHAYLVTPLRVRNQRNPTDYGQFFRLPGDWATWLATSAY